MSATLAFKLDYYFLEGFLQENIDIDLCTYCAGGEL